MKSILVPAGGSETDEPVFATALAAARPFSAHLQFVHIYVNPGQAAINTPHVEFASGAALVDALGQLQNRADDRSAAAARHVQEFCTRAAVDMVDVPRVSNAVTASWREEREDARQRLLFHARQSDLVVLGRAKRPNGLPPDLIEHLLIECGRPILLASRNLAPNLVGTVMVCWRETADATRAVMAAMPFLTRAARVVFATVSERGAGSNAAIDDAASQCRWHGVPTEVQVVPANGQPTADTLRRLAQSCGADLLVMGAYGHSRLRERIFGGCTQAMIEHADLPVLMLH
jgi:nucleotide-binding universal stress UspA family protein